MTQQTIYETITEDGFAVGQYYTTWEEARAAATVMGLSVRVRTAEGIEYKLDYPEREPQEWTLETILPESEM